MFFHKMCFFFVDSFIMPRKAFVEAVLSAMGGLFDSKFENMVRKLRINC